MHTPTPSSPMHSRALRSHGCLRGWSKRKLPSLASRRVGVRWAIRSCARAGRCIYTYYAPGTIIGHTSSDVKFLYVRTRTYVSTDLIAHGPTRRCIFADHHEQKILGFVAPPALRTLGELACPMLLLPPLSERLKLQRAPHHQARSRARLPTCFFSPIAVKNLSLFFLRYFLNNNSVKIECMLICVVSESVYTWIIERMNYFKECNVLNFVSGDTTRIHDTDTWLVLKNIWIFIGVLDS